MIDLKLTEENFVSKRLLKKNFPDEIKLSLSVRPEIKDHVEAVEVEFIFDENIEENTKSYKTKILDKRNI